MALLEKMQSMQQSGMSDAQIINSLKEEGVSPLEINEAISQLKIKAAIASENSEDSNKLEPSIMGAPSETQMRAQLTAQQSSASAQNETQSSQQQYFPQPEQVTPQTPLQSYTQEVEPQQVYADPNAQQYAYDPNAYAQYPNAQQYAYDPNQQAYYPPSTDIETIRDVSKQEIESALKKIKEQLDILSKTKTDISFQMQSMENRLVKVETVIEELQSAIIRKIGEYGEAISNISNEVKATQASFSKVLNPLFDKQRAKMLSSNEIEESKEFKVQDQEDLKEKSKKENSRKSQATPSFEDYLR